MARWGKTDFKQLKDLQKKMEKVYKKETQKFVEDCARELAARLLADVIKLTPVGKYDKVEVDVTDAEGSAVTYKRNGKGHKKGDVKKKLVRGKLGGTLRRGWTSKTHEEAESGSGATSPNAARDFVYKSLSVAKRGDVYIIEIINPVKYAAYVEYGHRQTPGRFVPELGKRLKAGWVPGKLMLTKAEIELAAQADGILNAKVKKYLEECFDV